MSRTRTIMFTLKEIHFMCFNSETLDQCCGFVPEGFEATDSNRPKQKGN